MATSMCKVETHHENMIHDAQMDIYGHRLATCSSDRSVRIFEVDNKQPKHIATLTGHEGPVWQLSWMHPMYGNALASCSYDKKVILWREKDRGQWGRFYTHEVHASSVNSIQWAPPDTGLYLACGSSDGNISVLQGSGDDKFTFSMIPTAHTTGVNAVSWAPSHPSGTTLDPSTKDYDVINKRFASGGGDNLVKIWKYSDEKGLWEKEVELKGHTNWVRDVAWAPDTGFTTSTIASCCHDGKVIIWQCKDLDSGVWDSKRTMHTFDDVVWHLSWSVMGDILAVSGGDNKVTLWKESHKGAWICISKQDTNKSS